jgi:5-methylcytosine-specific restriction endonuclease McrA
VIAVAFDPESLPPAAKTFWKRWSAKAQAATKQALADARAGVKHAFKDAIWAELKPWLLEHVFHGKCAYCETKIGVATAGAADHFRPKARVTTRTGDATAIVAVRGKPHPGYSWLAYQARNLLPACERCNTGGKLNHFPIEGTYVTRPTRGRTQPEELDAVERPLLLHPYVDRPQDHLCFGEGGVIAAKGSSRRGEASIACYSLKRGDLVADRQKEQELAWLKVEKALAEGGDAGVVMGPYRSGRKPYSAAVLDYVRLKLAQRIAKDKALLGAL